jgi:peptide/nickel transport system substrate-binding protein
VNFAVNRQSLAREAGAYGETPTDQFLQPGSPGFRDERIYPLRGPNLRRAKELARGRTRGGKAVLYTRDNALDVSQAQILQKNLKAIGIDLEIRPVAGLFERLTTPAEPFDFGRVRLFDRITPSLLHDLFDGRTIGEPGSINLSRFDSPKYNRLLDEASRLTGSARDEAYGDLDVKLSREAAPVIPVSRLYALALVSERVPRNCVVMNPNLDLTAVCLR